MRMPKPHGRRAFTLLEVTIVSGLTAFLAMLLASVWTWTNKAGFPHDVIIRGRVLQEMDMAVSALSRDLGGSLAIPSSLGNVAQGRWIGWQQVGNAELWLCYDGGANPDGMTNWIETPDTVIRYYLASDPDPNVATSILVREDQSANTTFAVARHVDSMVVDSDVSSGDEFVKVQLTFKYRRSDAEYTRKVTLSARTPQ
jgi:hypothetical protein